MLQRIIRKLKNDPSYTMENSYSSKDLLIIMGDRFWQIIRGTFRKPFFKASSGLVFIGKHVKIRHSAKISIGGSFIIGDYSYVNGLSKNGIIIGDNVSIGRNSTLICTGVIAQLGEGIVIGNGTGINEGAFLGGQGGIEIGENVIIGPGVKIFSENHVFEDMVIPIKKQGVTRIGVKIGDNCWIGSNVTILDGVNIAEGCIIAAGSVVNKPVAKNTIVGGVPAKFIKNRI